MERSTIVRVRDGLHARPATRFVKLAKTFVSEVEIVKDGKAVSAKSSVKLMLLGVREADLIIVRATGEDEELALLALIAYLENPEAGLDDWISPEVPVTELVSKPSTSQTSVLLPFDDVPVKGIAASEGFAVGAVYAYFPEKIVANERLIAERDIPAEIERLKTAISAVQRRMQEALANEKVSAADRGIIVALSEVTGDEVIREEMSILIKKGHDAVTAAKLTAEATAGAFSKMSDAYFKARADDVLSVGRQICLALLGKQDTGLQHVPAGAIVVAEDIGAFDLARAPLKLIGGIVCARGGATSHIAIIARAHGIPSVLGVGDNIEHLRHANELALDGGKGLLFSQPSEQARKFYSVQTQKAEQERHELQRFKQYYPKRKDGITIEVAANIGSLEEIEAAQDAGAMGIGLFRTELLFMRHKVLPSEQVQFENYITLAQAFAPNPVIIRTLDVGGDKPVAGIEFPEEENPFLGWRGVRMCLDRPDIFKIQLRALLRAAVAGNIKVMLPMVSDISELRRTRALIDECSAELKADNEAYAEFPLGVMIETPAAVFIAPELAKEAAFFSIGTNDLTQYVMAADRLNSAIAHLNDAANPAVMRAIAMIAKAGCEAGIVVGMCGEAAGRADLVPEFIKMGLTELSMSSSLILRTKKCLSELFIQNRQ